jgi:hypothetical protein
VQIAASLGHPLVLHAPIRCEGAHRPRLSVGEAVYQRERWELPAAELKGLAGVDLLLAVERHRRAGGWPRFVFTRVVGERKPYLIDTRSPFALRF